MKENESALYSHYIIDGMRCPCTPAQLMEECMDSDVPAPAGIFEDIIDEITEPPLSSFTYRKTRYKEYVSQVSQRPKQERPFRLLYPDHFTRLQIAKALLARLWSEGHFKLGDLRIWAQWEWLSPVQPAQYRWEPAQQARVSTQGRSGPACTMLSQAARAIRWP